MGRRERRGQPRRAARANRHRKGQPHEAAENGAPGHGAPSNRQPRRSRYVQGTPLTAKPLGAALLAVYVPVKPGSTVPPGAIVGAYDGLVTVTF